MGYCSIDNHSKEILEENGINSTEFMNTIDVIADIVLPKYNGVLNNINGMSIFVGDNKTAINTVAEFLKNPYHKSFLEFCSNNDYLREYLRDTFELYSQNTNTYWEAYVKSLFSIMKEWDKYAKTCSKINNTIRSTVNSNPFLISLLKPKVNERGDVVEKSHVLNNDKNRKYEGYEILDDIADELTTDNYANILDIAIRQLMYPKGDFESTKTILTEYFNANFSDIKNLELDASYSEFTKKVNSIISSIKNTNKRTLKNNKEKLNAIFSNIININKELDNVYNDEELLLSTKEFANKTEKEQKSIKDKFEADKSSLSSKKVLLYKELKKIGRAEIKSTLSGLLLDNDIMYSLIRDSLINAWNTNNLNKNSTEERELSEKNKKEIFEATYDNPFFPWFENNTIPETEWNKLKDIVADGISVKDLFNKYRKENGLLSEFLNAVSSKSNPIVRVININDIPDGKLKKQIDNFTKNHGHIPASIYVTATKNKELGHTSDGIYIIDDGSNNHSFTLENITHEWLHALTTSSMFLKEGMNESLEIISKHCLNLYLDGKIDLKGIDTSKLNLVSYGSKLAPYAFFSSSELLAETFNNPELQKLLKRIKSPFKTKKKQSILDWFIEKISNFINKLLKSVGAKINDGTVLTEVVLTGGAAMNLTMLNDGEKYDDIISDSEYGIYKNPTKLNDFNDFQNEVINNTTNISESEISLIKGCNNIITPSLTSDINEEEDVYTQSEFTERYNEMCTDEEDYINNRNYSEDTIAAAYLNNDVYLYGNQEASNAISNTINTATKILNMGGRVVTYSKSYIESDIFNNKANSLIYKALLDSGYTPHELDNRVVWTQDKLSKDEVEKYLLDSKKLDMLNPTIEINGNKCIVRPDVEISEQLKNATEGACVIKVRKGNPLYEQLSMINSDDTELQIHSNSLYYGKVTDVKASKNTLSITFDLHISEFSNVNTKDFDAEMFENTNVFNIKDNGNLSLKIGIKKTKWRTDMVANDMILKITELARGVKVPEWFNVNDNESERIKIFFQTNSYDSVIEKLKNDYESYINDEDYRLKLERALVRYENEKYCYEYTEEEIESIAQKRIAKKVEAFKEMMPYFDSLVMNSAKKVAEKLGLSITFYSKLIQPNNNEEEDLKNKQESGSLAQSTDIDNYDSQNTEDTDFEESDDNNTTEDEYEDSEAIGKDHWVVSSANQDIHDTVNKRIRKILSNIQKVDSQGYVMEDDLGNILYEDEREVFNTLLEITHDLQDINSMMTAIDNYASNGHSNYYTIVDTIMDNEELKSLFFVGLCNQHKNIESILSIDNNNYVKHHNRDSRYEWIEKAVTNSINQKEHGTINASNRSNIAESLVKKIIKAKANKLVTDKKISLLQECLKTIGIILSKDDIQRTVTAKSVDEYNEILDKISEIAKFCINNDNSLSSTSRFYKDLSNLLKDSIPVSQQSMTFCEGKLYPSYNKQSYISRAFSKLKSFKNLKDRREYMDKEFRQYSQYYTKNNLDEMISGAKELKLNELVSFLNDMKKVSEEYGDYEVMQRLNHIYDDLIRKQINSIGIFYRMGFWNYKWLEDIYTSDSLELPYELSDIISVEGTSYNKMSEKEHLMTMLVKAKENNGKIAIAVPIYADANCWNFIYCKPVKSENRIVAYFKNLMLSEIERVKCIRQRDENRIKAIKEFNKRVKELRDRRKSAKPKERASIDSELNNLMPHDIKGYSYPITNFDIEREVVYKKDGTIDEDKLNNIKKAKGLKYQFFEYKEGNGSMEDQIRKQLSERFNKFLSYTKKVFAVRQKDGNIIYPKMPSEQELRSFFYEHSFATANILGMTSQPYFYKDSVDFQKRYKEVYALTSRLNINAAGGRKWQRGIILDDRILNNFKDAAYNVLSENFAKILKESKNLTKANKVYIKKQFSKVNATDAQAIRTPSSYIAIKTMMGEWGENAQLAWKKLCSGNIDVKSMYLLMGIIKPFTRSTYSVQSGTSYGKLKVPIQYKNSEFMSPYGSGHKTYTQTATDPVLAALTDFMEDNFIDVANFVSATKVGSSACIDLNDCKSYQDAIDVLYQSTGLKKLTTEERENIQNNINNETVDTPYVWYNEEIIKTTPYTDWGVVAPNPEHFTDKRANFGVQIKRIFQADIIDNEYYEIETVEYQPVDNYKVSNNNKKVRVDKNELKEEGFIQSGGTTFRKVVVKKRVLGSEIKAKYNELISQNYAKSYQEIEELFKDKDKLAMFLDETITNDSKMSDEVKQLLKRDNDGNFINMADPLFSDKIHQILMSKQRNTVTKQKIAGGTCVQVSCMWDDTLSLHFKEDSDGNTVLDYADCYLPCYMKSLYAYCLNDNGLLDVERLKQECIKRNDMDTFEALTTMIGYRTPTEGVSSCIPLRIKGFLPPSAGSCVVLPKEITVLSGSDFDVDKLYIMRHEFTIGKDGFPKVIKDSSTKGNNNKIIDTMLGLMSTRQFTERFLNPSGAFDDLIKSVDIISILDGTSEKDNIDISELKQLDPDSVSEYKDKIGIKSNNGNISLLSPEFQTYYHEQNFLGKNMLSLWAVAKSACDLLQNCHLKVKRPLIYNGNALVDIAPMLIKDGKTEIFLTQIVKQYLAASADNTKNPVQSKLGITKNNINAVVYLTLLGLDSTSIALILRAAKRFEGDINGMDDKFKKVQYLLNDKNLCYPDENACFAAKYFLNQAQLTGSFLMQLISVLRADSEKGSLKKDIYETISFKTKIDNILNKISSAKSPIIADGLIDSLSPISSNNILKSKIGFVQQAFDYGVRSYFGNTKDILPEFGELFSSIFNECSMLTKSGDLSSESAKQIEKNFYYYKTLELSFFGDEMIDGKLVTAKEKIESYKKNMPSYFRKFISEHTDILENGFVKRLQLRTNSSNPDLEELTFPNAFRYEREIANEIKGEFLSLFQSENEEVRKFAWNLVKYSFYRQGFNFKGDGYGHMIDRSILSKIPGYLNLMQDIQSGVASKNDFVQQFITKDSALLKQIPTIYTLDDIVIKEEVADANGKKKKLPKDVILKRKLAEYIYKNYKEEDRPIYIVYKDKIYDTEKILYSESIDYGVEIDKDKSFISYQYLDSNSNDIQKSIKRPFQDIEGNEIGNEDDRHFGKQDKNGGC